MAVSCCQGMEKVFESCYFKNIGVEHNGAGWLEISVTDRRD